MLRTSRRSHALGFSRPCADAFDVRVWRGPLPPRPAAWPLSSRQPLLHLPDALQRRHRPKFDGSKRRHPPRHPRESSVRGGLREGAAYSMIIPEPRPSPRRSVGGTPTRSSPSLGKELPRRLLANLRGLARTRLCAHQPSSSYGFGASEGPSRRRGRRTFGTAEIRPVWRSESTASCSSSTREPASDPSV